LEEEVHILGWPRAILHVSSTARVVAFTANLSDVAVDGTSHLVAKGMLNATRRVSLTEPSPVVPGEVFELDIEIDCTSWVFARGHRIRLSIASADWPNVWPTPEPATNQVYRGPSHPSRLILPVVPAEGSAAAPLFHPSPRSVAAPSAATHPPTWKVCRDQLTGRTMVEIRHGAEERVNDTTVVERESWSNLDVNPFRPSDASARGKHVVRIVRPNHVTQSQADVAVQATATHFHIEIGLVVQVNGAQHFTKQWVESVPRNCD
jgi:hypothetical protein